MDNAEVTELAKTINRALKLATARLEAENKHYKAALQDIALGPRQEPDFIRYVIRKAQRTLESEV